MRAIERDFPLTVITNNDVPSAIHFVLLSLRAQDHLELEGDFGSSPRLAL
jgi:hypothetical protein